MGWGEVGRGRVGERGNRHGRALSEVDNVVGLDGDLGAEDTRARIHKVAHLQKAANHDNCVERVPRKMV